MLAQVREGVPPIHFNPLVAYKLRGMAIFALHNFKVKLHLSISLSLPVQLFSDSCLILLGSNLYDEFSPVVSPIVRRRS